MLIDLQKSLKKRRKRKRLLCCTTACDCLSFVSDIILNWILYLGNCVSLF